jgi:membrane protease YdiL (CAAX protease family)
MAGEQAGLEVGRRRFLHPGPLRWLRATGWMLLLFVVMAIGYALIQGLSGPNALDVLKVSLACVAGFGVYALAVRLCEGRWPEELSLKAAPLDLLAGVVVGSVIMAMVVGILCLLGVYEVSGPHAGSPWRMAAIAIESGFMEELIARAILMRLLMRAFGAWPSLVIQAALFGAAHLGNPNATPTAAIAIAVEAGFLLAAFYLLTGRLWMSVGVHVAWNFTQGWLWGAPVSGTDRTPSLFTSGPKPGAPEFLSGGDFGPEASLPCIVVGTAVAAIVLWWAWKKGNFKALPDAAPQ